MSLMTRPAGEATAAQADLYLEHEGIRLRYRDEGHGPAVLLVHGWTLDLEMWEPQVAALRSEYRLIRWDRRGFGLSAGAADLDDDVADAAALCRHLRVSPIACVGMSQGARVALQLARREPELVSVLILDGPADESLGCSQPVSDVPLVEFRSIMRLRGVEAFRHEWRGHPLATLRTQDEGARSLLDRMIARYGGADLADPPSEPRNGPNGGPRGTVRQPLLVINGEFDLESRRESGRALARSLGGQQILIRSAGHLSNLDSPRIYSEVLRGFLRPRLPAGGWRPYTISRERCQ
ncbi:MAG TPA: alpha/beta hydrolase [Steroidobacteraceae bacterium]|jgi:pimeloyl-ACP methyl ester carboxylesterase